MKFALGLLLIGVAWWYSRIERSVSLEESTLVGWKKQLGAPLVKFKRVALGYKRLKASSPFIALSFP